MPIKTLTFLIFKLMHGKIAQNFVTLILSVADRRDDVATIDFKAHSVEI